jgi:aspartyl-tRNA(Asn)/glutamyl-tRNA(Gln) amidotransferase subunit B
MRVEVNISISKNEKFGTKVEVKNINSFRAAGKAIDFELARQSELLERGEKVVQETRGWDENKEITFSQRSKENANDYRYFPDPDLPKLVISEIPEFGLDELKKDLPELPNDKRLRYEKDFGIKSSDIETYINNIEAGLFLEKLGVELADSGNESIKLASNYIISDIVGLSKAGGSEFNLGFVTVENFSQLIKMIINGDLSSRGAKDTLKIMYEIGGEPSVIAKEKGYIQKNDPEEIKKIMQEIIDNNQDSVSQYKNGKDSLLQFFVGQGMKAMKGSGNPELIKSIVLELLK